METWRCPTCGHEARLLAGALEVSHSCPKAPIGRKSVRFVKAPALAVGNRKVKA